MSKVKAGEATDLMILQLGCDNLRLIKDSEQPTNEKVACKLVGKVNGEFRIFDTPITVHPDQELLVKEYLEKRPTNFQG